MFLLILLQDPILFSRLVLILIISICLHELGHGFAAISQGDDTPISTGHMTLNPMVHMGGLSLVFLIIAGITWGAMPVNPARFRTPKWSDILVSAAGPATNLLLAILAMLVLRIMNTLDATLLSQEFFLLLARLNLMLCFFNMLPIPQLDGFHIYSELFSSLKPLRYSQAGLVIMMVFFITGAGSVLSKLADWILAATI